MGMRPGMTGRYFGTRRKKVSGSNHFSAFNSCTVSSNCSACEWKKVRYVCAFSSGLSLQRLDYQCKLGEDKVLFLNLCGKVIFSAFKTFKWELVVKLMSVAFEKSPDPLVPYGHCPLARQYLCPSYLRTEQEE